MTKHLYILLAITLFAASCTTYERCVARFGRVPADTLLVPFEVIVPKDSIRYKLVIDSIPYLVPGEVRIVESEHSRARIRYWRDKYNNLLMQAECDTIVIRDTIMVPHPVILEPPPPPPRGKLRIAWEAFKGAPAMFILPGVILIVIIYIITKRVLR